MFGLFKKTQLVDEGDALPGRAAELVVSPHHAVNGNPLKEPWPGNMEQLIVGMGFVSEGAERKFWQRGTYTRRPSGTLQDLPRTQPIRRSVRV